MRRFILAAVVLSGCNSMPPAPLPPPLEVVRVVEVPVAVRCGAEEKIGPEPDYAATKEKILDVPHKGAIEELSDQQAIENLFYVVNILTVDRLQRVRRDRIKSDAIASC